MWGESSQLSWLPAEETIKRRVPLPLLSETRDGSREGVSRAAQRPEPAQGARPVAGFTGAWASGLAGGASVW